MKIAIKIAASLFLTCIFFSNVNAQHKDTSSSIKYSRDSTIQVIITLKDQSTIKGIIMTMNLEEISLKTDFAGTIIIKQSNIISIVNYKYAETQKQEYTRIYNPNNPNNPNDLDIVKIGGSSNYYNRPFTPFTNNNRYNFSNNYVGLKKNELLYNNIWVLYNGLDYGINDNLAIGGGVLFLGLGGFINVIGRGQIHLNENIKIGASYNYFMLFNSTGSSSSNEYNFGLLSGGITFAGKKGNISLSIANGYYNNNLGKSTSETLAGFSFSGSFNISDKASLISDNFYILNKINPRSYSIGLRIKGRSGNFDFGLMSYSYEDNSYNYYSSGSSTYTKTIPIPYLSLTQKIN